MILFFKTPSESVIATEVDHQFFMEMRNCLRAVSCQVSLWDRAVR